MFRRRGRMRAKREELTDFVVVTNLARNGSSSGSSRRAAITRDARVSISSSKLSVMLVQPEIKVNKEDKRFFYFRVGQVQEKSNKYSQHGLIDRQINSFFKNCHTPAKYLCHKYIIYTKYVCVYILLCTEGGGGGRTDGAQAAKEAAAPGDALEGEVANEGAKRDVDTC